MYYSPFMAPYGYGMDPILYSMTQSPNLGTQWRAQNALDDYVQPGNIANNMASRMALDHMLTSSLRGSKDSDTPVSSLMLAVLGIGAFKVFGGVFNAYDKVVKGIESNHPGLANFRNLHPVIGNTLAYTPGVVAGGSVAGGMAVGGWKLYKRAAQIPAVRDILHHPAAKWAAGLAVVGLVFGTSLWGKFIGRAKESGDQFKTAYRDELQKHGDLDPKALKQRAIARLNQQRYLQQQLGQQANLMQQLDPGVIEEGGSWHPSTQLPTLSRPMEIDPLQEARPLWQETTDEGRSSPEASADKELAEDNAPA